MEPKIPKESLKLRKKIIEAEYIKVVKIAAKRDKQLDLKIYSDALALILDCPGLSFSRDHVISNMEADTWQAASVKGDFFMFLSYHSSRHQP